MKLDLTTIGTVAIGAIGVLGTTLALAATAQNPPDKVTIDACKSKKPPVEFNHKKHTDELKIECGSCHHTQKDLEAGSAVEVKRCTECHADPEKAETPSCNSSSHKKNNFHIQCLGCHKETAKKDPSKKDLKKCGTCHKK
jgi:hypothetical protein